MRNKWLKRLALVCLLVFIYQIITSKQSKSTAKPPVPIQSHKQFLPLQFHNIRTVQDQKYYSNNDQSEFKFIKNNRYIKISGFSFCSILDYATFDTMVPIRDLQGSLAEINPDVNDFINIIDSKAYDIYQALLRKFHMGHMTDVSRLACYTAAEGQTVVANLTYNRLLSEINPQSYFSPILTAIIPSPQPVRKKYLIAYLVMVHDKKGFHQLTDLLELLDDGKSITLIHVDARPASTHLHKLVSDYIHKRKRIVPHSALHLAKHRFSNIWGHISLVFTQLSGFWELLDLADWDYIINLSNYDFPLKTTAQIHYDLQLDGNLNYIQYWSDTSDLAERFYRVHLGQSDYSSVYHPYELGLVTWPYNNWKPYKHHQWMIITPEACRFLRKDQRALTFLAFAEHSFIPDESWFGTVLVNSPEFHGKIVNDNKRYLRFGGGAHPSWLGYSDRHLFPPFEQRPSFYFIRKYNSRGAYFGEDRLLRWIKMYHYIGGLGNDIVPQCTLQLMSVQVKCIKQIVQEKYNSSSVIIIPISSSFAEIVENLVCSLQNIGINNIVYWALDLAIFENLVANGKLAIMLPGVDPLPGNNMNRDLVISLPKSEALIHIMRYKPRIIKMVLDAGLDVWFLDGDTVVLKDFTTLVGDADVYTAALNADLLWNKREIALSTGIMYFAQTQGARKILAKWTELISNSMLNDDENAMNRLKNRDKELALILPNGENVYEAIGKDIPKLRILDPFQVISSHVFVTRPQLIPNSFSDYYVLHTHSRKHKETMSGLGVWFLEGKECKRIKDIKIQFQL